MYAVVHLVSGALAGAAASACSGAKPVGAIGPEDGGRIADAGGVPDGESPGDSGAIVNDANATDSSADTSAPVVGCTTSSDCQAGYFCDVQATASTPGTCCPAFGCNPFCPNGVLRDARGCATCQCASGPDAGDAATASCTSDADCPNGDVCGFPESGGCAATGSCFPRPGAVCLAYSPGCACDGSEITVVCTGLPSGYVSKPLLHTGACSDGGSSDAGSAFDAGSCCPATWSLYACTEPDGGAGMACHNPAMGCASSLTCGQGCDRVVTGRCP